MAEHVVEEDRDLARRCGDRLGLADAGRQTAVEGAQRRRRGPTAAAASRSSAAARLPERRVRADSTLPPEILLWGARLSHDVKMVWGDPGPCHGGRDAVLARLHVDQERAAGTWARQQGAQASLHRKKRARRPLP